MLASLMQSLLHACSIPALGLSCRSAAYCTQAANFFRSFLYLEPVVLADLFVTAPLSFVLGQSPTSIGKRKSVDFDLEVLEQAHLNHVLQR